MIRSILRAFLITLYPPIQSMPTPAVVTEENEIEEEIVYDDFQGETRKMLHLIMWLTPLLIRMVGSLKFNQLMTISSEQIF